MDALAAGGAETNRVFFELATDDDLAGGAVEHVGRAIGEMVSPLAFREDLA